MTSEDASEFDILVDVDGADEYRNNVYQFSLCKESIKQPYVSSSMVLLTSGSDIALATSILHRPISSTLRKGIWA